LLARILQFAGRPTEGLASMERAVRLNHLRARVDLEGLGLGHHGPGVAMGPATAAAWGWVRDLG
jgi:hypothetical protein